MDALNIELGDFLQEKPRSTFYQMLAKLQYTKYLKNKTLQYY